MFFSVSFVLKFIIIEIIHHEFVFWRRQATSEPGPPPPQEDLSHQKKLAVYYVFEALTMSIYITVLAYLK